MHLRLHIYCHFVLWPGKKICVFFIFTSNEEANVMVLLTNCDMVYTLLLLFLFHFIYTIPNTLWNKASIFLFNRFIFFVVYSYKNAIIYSHTNKVDWYFYVKILNEIAINQNAHTIRSNLKSSAVYTIQRYVIIIKLVKPRSRKQHWA